MHLRLVLLFLALFSLGACQSTDTAFEKSTKAESSGRARHPAANPEENQALYNQYCKLNSATDAVAVPSPNYENILVANARDKFKYIAANSIYLYPAVTQAYGLKKPTTWQERAENFLVYLCGEFRDRPTLLEAKLQWLQNFNKLAAAGGQPKIDPSKNVWMQMTAEAYQPYLDLSRSLWSARQQRLVTKKQTFGKIANVDSAVPAITVCETKFIFNDYIADKKQFFAAEDGSADVSLVRYEEGFKKYAATDGNCSPADLSDYYDFRGDSNFKPNSPESNGMIWYTLYISSNCENLLTAKIPVEGKKAGGIDSETCAQYFKNPFYSRWNAAKAGLATWMLYPVEYSDKFSNDSGQLVVIYPHRLVSADALKPFAFGFEQNQSPIRSYLISDDKIGSAFQSADLGFDELYGLGNESIEMDKLEFVYTRLRDAVNRHTNWFKSGWDDGLKTLKSYRATAYSPFVASSYEMSESNRFTSCGFTVSCPPDGFKHWMFVFRVKGANWYSTDRLANLKDNKIDFERMWFDETSFGTTGLAKTERAWDRLGTALEDELQGGAILYLHNITATGAVSDDGIK